MGNDAVIDHPINLNHKVIWYSELKSMLDNLFKFTTLYTVKFEESNTRTYQKNNVQFLG